MVNGGHRVGAPLGSRSNTLVPLNTAAANCPDPTPMDDPIEHHNIAKLSGRLISCLTDCFKYDLVTKVWTQTDYANLLWSVFVALDDDRFWIGRK